jgi:hypothetical protein
MFAKENQPSRLVFFMVLPLRQNMKSKPCRLQGKCPKLPQN